MNVNDLNQAWLRSATNLQVSESFIVAIFFQSALYNKMENYQKKSIATMVTDFYRILLY